jgi:hypothetical protein
LAASSLVRRFQARRCRGNSPRFRGEEPVNETLRRLIGSSVVVGPASVSRRHERPSRMAVSRRSGTSRPPRWAARLQARVGSASASPPPVEPTNPGQRTVPSASWPGAPCACWPTRRCCQVGTPPGGAIGPNFRGTHGCCRTVLGSATPSEDPWCVPGLSSWWRFATYRLRRSCTALSGGRLTYARLRGRSPRLVA